jgi:hypothetical protein
MTFDPDIEPLCILPVIDSIVPPSHRLGPAGMPARTRAAPLAPSIDDVRFAAKVLTMTRGKATQTLGESVMRYRVCPVALAATAVLACNIASSAQTVQDGPDGRFAAGALRPTGGDSNPACRAAARYVELSDTGQYDKVGTLFATNATYFGPNDEVMEGAAKIGAFYTVFLSNAKPHVQMASMVPAGPHDCFIELQGTTANYLQKTPGAIDRFTTDETGKVSRLYIYFRPGTVRALGPAAAPALGK